MIKRIVIATALAASALTAALSPAVAHTPGPLNGTVRDVAPAPGDSSFQFSEIVGESAHTGVMNSLQAVTASAGLSGPLDA